LIKKKKLELSSFSKEAKLGELELFLLIYIAQLYEMYVN